MRVERRHLTAVALSTSLSSSDSFAASDMNVVALRCSHEHPEGHDEYDPSDDGASHWRLLRSQGAHGIDPRRARGGYAARDRRHAGQQRDHAEISNGVQMRYAKQHRGD